MNEDEMAEMEVRAGEELERTMARYARVRLDPSTAQVRRARDSVMEAAWRQRIVGAGTDELDTAAHISPAADVARPAAVRPVHGPFAGWGARRLGGSLAAAVLAGLLVGTTAFAASRAGGPLYDARIALEELTLPADSGARLEAELALAQGRLAEIVDAVARNDPGGVTAAIDGYREALDDLSGSTGAPADRALAAIRFHRSILLDLLTRVPETGRAGIAVAIANSDRVIDLLTAAGTTPTIRNGDGAGAGSGGAGAGGAGAGNGRPGAGGGGNAGGPNGQGGKPSQEPAPAKSPAPQRTPRPARTEEPAAASTPAPAPTEKAPKGGAGGSGQGERQGGQADQP